MIFRSFITRDDLIPSINGITGPIRQTLEKFGSTIEKVELFADRKITSHKINQQGLIFLKKEIENKRIQYMCVQLDVGDFTKTPKNKILEELKTRYRNVWGKSEDDELTPLINSREINSKEWLISLHKDLRIEFKLTDDLNVIVNDDSTWGSILAGDLDRCIESGHKLNQFTANGNIDIPLVLVGEPGVEKKFLVRKIEQILFPYSQGIQEFDCNASNSNESLQQIFGNALDNTPGIIEEVENEMLYITGLEDANHEIQESIIDVISTRTFSPANSDRANTKEAKCLFVIGINGSLENVPNALLN
ncbi:MAG: sigma 54-interacting transcriptional regulator, partial [SAR202 cluster bacterium]|nr:sigma 54-interacting transcriptional regulator [SAR202 cluster bacterium]